MANVCSEDCLVCGRVLSEVAMVMPDVVFLFVTGYLEQR